MLNGLSRIRNRDSLCGLYSRHLEGKEEFGGLYGEVSSDGTDAGFGCQVSVQLVLEYCSVLVVIGKEWGE